ncbi:Hsp20 family protein, partial [candidate division WOR-3 bacterium]|nr:Hsp20 family protein [candidate division WOR-3 bacterium]MBD3363631.1 Hsp20 family protein [candidate division WOR-3 bacterium]
VFIMAEVPGIPKDSLEVKINKDYVEIAGVRKEPDFFTRATHFYKLETYYGCFRRRFTLPVEIDTQKAKIVLIDGILTISIPRLKKRVIQIPVE